MVLKKQSWAICLHEKLAAVAIQGDDSLQYIKKIFLLSGYRCLQVV